MRLRTICLSILILLSLWLAPPAPAAEPSQVFALWPEGKIPGETRIRGEEVPVTDRRRPFVQYTNISIPTLAVFLPPPEKRTGAVVLACPGGGLQRLAYQHEGLEIADWLTPQGITVFVLKYRVPAPGNIGLMDAQRAMGLIRSRAEEFQIDPDRINVMGFSAGGEIAALLATQHEKRSYEPLDKADELSCRPDNVALIYPGGISRGPTLRQDIAAGLKRDITPPMFLVHAFADASENTLAMATALKQQRIPCEVHLYEEGGHGFGARDTGLPLNSWKERFQAWIAADGFFDKPSTVAFTRQFAQAVEKIEEIPRFSQLDPAATLLDAYAAQRRYVKSRLPKERIVGFKASSTTGADNVRIPVTAVLFESGRLAGNTPQVIQLVPREELVVETELGYIISNGVDISTRLANLEQVKGAVEAVVPVIELPTNARRRMPAGYSGVDLVAANIGSGRFIVGSQKLSPDEFNPDDIEVTLAHVGDAPLRAYAGNIPSGQWENLRKLINTIVDQGYTLRSGDIIIAGTITPAQPATAGAYVADFGKLGKLEFEVR